MEGANPICVPLLDPLKRVMDSTLNCSTLMWEEYSKFSTLSGPEVQGYQKKLESAMRTICDVYMGVSVVDEATSEMEGITSNAGKAERFDELVQSKRASRKASTEHPMYVKLTQIPNNFREEESERDISMRCDQRNVKCPISKRVMTIPMRNKLCGHTYDQQSILGLLKLSKNGIKCPVPGCIGQRFKLANLEVDEELKAHIEQQ